MKKCKPITDYNYISIYDYKKGKYNKPVRIRYDLTSSSRQDILRYLQQVGLVDKYTMKCFKRVYSSIALKYNNLYDCYEFQEFLSNIWLIICEIPQSKWDEIWNNAGRTGVTAFVSGIIHRTVISTASRSYRSIIKYQRDNITYDNDGWNILQEEKTPEEMDPFVIGSW